MTEDQRHRPPPTGTRAAQSEPDAPTLLQSPESQHGERRPGTLEIPNFRVLELLGMGGMGEVWAAEQLRPIQRKVALKIIKLGMDSRQIVARFQQERRALALMSHPNIAAVYEAGTTADGRPYFAMEYVPGEAVSVYCNRHQLSIQDRLKLFLKICDGVQHAHQKGIIHRDLKPSNVLVTIQDNTPLPKIVDFGLAKATSQHHLSDETMHTAIGAVVGTLEYMSPEQLELTGLDIDTRSDIYSLGVLLYKLLVDTVPFDKRELGGSHLDELRRIIREKDPSKPSTRLSSVHENGAKVARDRGQEHLALVKRIRGDLDWITLKALAKDRTQRYQTANALAMDIRRHLANEPVLARPPSAAYKMRKFVRRHRAGVVAAGLVFLAVIGGTIGTTAGLLRALRAERKAVQEAETAKQVSDFLVGIFRIADPNKTQGETITARQILEEGSRRISRELQQQPMTRARLMNTMGTVYRNLGLYEESRTLLEDALELRRGHLDGDSLELADSLVAMASLDMLEGRNPAARTRAERALAIRREALPADSPAIAKSLMVLGWVLTNQSDHAAAVERFERALEILRRAEGEESLAVAEVYYGLGFSRWRLGESERAERLLRKALRTYELLLGLDDSRLSGVLNDLAVFYQDQRQDDKALPLLERALAIKQRVLGPSHPDLASSLNNLAIAHDRAGRPAEAEPLVTRALALIEASYGSNHQGTALALANAAWISYRQGKLDEAQARYERALAIYQGTVGRTNHNVAILLQDWSLLHADRGQLGEAERLLEEAAEVWEATAGPDSPNLAACLELWADICERQGKLAQAETLRHRARGIRS